MASRVIGSEHVAEAAQRGRRMIEVLPGDIVTATARESAERLKIALVDGPVHFVGLSMGGFVGLRLALHHPELLRSLTLMLQLFCLLDTSPSVEAQCKSV